MPSKHLLSGLAWRAAMSTAAVILIIALVYTVVQLITVLNSRIGFA